MCDCWSLIYIYWTISRSSRITWFYAGAYSKFWKGGCRRTAPGIFLCTSPEKLLCTALFASLSYWTNFNFAHTVRDQTRKFRGLGRWINIAEGKLLLLALSRGVYVKNSRSLNRNGGWKDVRRQFTFTPALLWGGGANQKGSALHPRHPPWIHHCTPY